MIILGGLLSLFQHGLQHCVWTYGDPYPNEDVDMKFDTYEEGDQEDDTIMIFDDSVKATLVESKSTFVVVPKDQDFQDVMFVEFSHQGTCN